MEQGHQRHERQHQADRDHEEEIIRFLRHKAHDARETHDTGNTDDARNSGDTYNS